LRAGLDILLNKLAVVIDRFAKWAKQYRELACLGWTHFQPAQLVTGGKTATLWLQVRSKTLSILGFDLAFDKKKKGASLGPSKSRASEK